MYHLKQSPQVLGLGKANMDGDQLACVEAINQHNLGYRPQEVAVIPQPTSKTVAYRVGAYDKIEIMSDVDHAYYLNRNGINCAGGWQSLEVPVNADHEEMKALAKIQSLEPKNERIGMPNPTPSFIT